MELADGIFLQSMGSVQTPGVIVTADKPLWGDDISPTNPTFAKFLAYEYSEQYFRYFAELGVRQVHFVQGRVASEQSDGASPQIAVKKDDVPLEVLWY